MNPIAVAIPLFFVAICAELLVARARGLRIYRFTDAVTDLGCGVTQQVSGVLLHAALAAPYLGLYAATPLRLGSGWAVHLGTFLAVDLLYYAWHRFTHEVNVGWTTHVVHHQSEDYHLAVALRQSLTSSISSWPFYLPLAVLGVPPEVFFLHSALNTLYQFWIHTELVGRLGPLEWVLNTPSHHRVHHAVNPQYLDKNYAGVLIVWDRLFGTFVAEEEEPVYGTVEPMNDFHVLWANVWWFAQLASDTAAAPTAREKLRLWFAPPAWRPTGLPPHPTPNLTRRADQVKHDPPAGPALTAHVVLHFLVAAVLVELLLLAEPAPALTAGLVAWVFATVSSWGGWFEQRAWRVPVEVARALATPVLGFALAGAPGSVAGAALAAEILGFVALSRRPAAA